MKRSIIRSLTVAALSAGSLLALSACDNVQGAVYEPGTPVKVGLICLHDSNSTYDANFINALNEAVSDLGAEKVVFSEDCLLTGIEETQDCYNAAKDLVKKGCNVIFADSFGHQEFMLKAAEKWPSVTFCHATGTNAKTADLDNYHNAFASIYEGRYLAGLAAGARLYCDQYQAMAEAESTSAFQAVKVGYVGAYSYAEVKSGYTAWFLGVRAALDALRVDPEKVTMDVRCTGSWYDITKEADAATALISDGAVLISQHADSMGAPGVCEDHNPVIPNVTYNISTKEACPNSYLAYSRINWAPYYKAVVNALYADTAIEGEENHNWTGTMASGSVEASIDIDNIVKNLPEAAKSEAKTELQRMYNNVVEGLRLGTVKVFDVDTFKVTVVTEGDDKKNVNATVDANGHLTAYNADTDGDYAPDTNVIATDSHNNKYFDESKYCSAPYFDLDIDGITVVTAAY